MIKLDGDEKLVREVRRHWVLILTQGLSILLVAILPLLLWRLVENGLSTLPFLTRVEAAAPALILGLYALWLLILWMIFAIDWTNYYLDVWYLTDKRLVDVEQKGIFHRDEATLRLEAIQDVTIEVEGFLATLLGFGHIIVQSAGTEREFILRYAARPEAVKRELLALHEAATNKPEAVTVVN